MKLVGDKMKKVVCVIFLFLMIIVSFFSYSLAAESQERSRTIDDTISGADQFISGANTTGTFDEEKLQENIGIIYNIFFACGLVVAMAGGIALGIKFMTGSIESKAETKELLKPYLVGCVIIFGAFGIWKVVMSVAGIFNS